MSTVNLFTYSDAIEHALALTGSGSSGQERRDALRAVRAAYSELPTARRWGYYYQQGRVNTVAPYSTGTIAYDHTGGTVERQLTLSSGTWPTWAAFGVVAISGVSYQVSTRVSGTVVQLSVNSNPGADVAASTAYTIYRDTYPMPADFLSADQFAATGSSIAMPEYVHPSEWLLPQQLQISPASPRLYTFTSDPHYYGVMAVRFHPGPDAIYPFDFIYQRRPRPITIDEYKTGTVTGTLGSADITGTGTTWTSKHIGCSFRFGTTTDYPTGLAGLTPFQEERVVTAVGSATTITLDQALADNYTGVKYVISDPIDIEDGAMLVAFLRCIEAQETITRNMKTKMDWRGLYKEALISAMENDNRSFAERAPSQYRYAVPLRYYPRGADVS